MFNFDIIEKQISKRLQIFFAHQATAANIDPARMQLIISPENNTVVAFIYESGRLVKNLELKAIAESFGKEFDQKKVQDVYNYLLEKAKADEIKLENLNVVICENKGRMSAYVYDSTTFKRKIKAMELLNIFYFSR